MAREAESAVATLRQDIARKRRRRRSSSSHSSLQSSNNSSNDDASVSIPTASDATLASRLLFGVLCLTIVLSALAFGTNNTWALGLFQTLAGASVVLWIIDAWRQQRLIVSRNLLQIPLAGLLLIAFIQLLPSGNGNIDLSQINEQTSVAAIVAKASATLSFDPNATRLAMIKVWALLAFFAAALVFINSPRRLRRVVALITIFGAVLAMVGMIQAVTSPNFIYGFRQVQYAVPFGPFVNRHHFAGYMALAIAPALGLLFTGSVSRTRRLLYMFAALLMGVALIMTGSRGAMISLVCEIVFLAIITGAVLRDESNVNAEEATKDEARFGLIKRLAPRLGIAVALLIVVLAGVIIFGGEASLERIVGSVNTDDPTNGRTHFWATTTRIIKDYPLIGVGLGAFPLAYTRYDTANGIYRLEQSHNDYLQILADTGLVGGALGGAFIVILFRTGFRRLRVKDDYRRGVAAGALAGCCAALVHSFFDFSLQTTANALLFLVMCALATLDERVEDVKRKRRHRSSSTSQSSPNANRKDGKFDSVEVVGDKAQLVS